MKIIKKAILPLGFRANGIACGIKKLGKLDLCLIFSDTPALAVCRVTSNKIPAAPVLVNKRHLSVSNRFQAIIANSGNANAFTGREGLKDAELVVNTLASTLAIKPETVLVASTGIIGKRLPVAKIQKAVPELANGLSPSGIDKAKRAIMTTDKLTKEATVKFNISGKVVSICGIAKGSGMIAPYMATMLAFIFTDADISQGVLKQALKKAVESSFNCITVDGCMSTNDTVILLANRQARNKIISEGKGLETFQKGLNIVCLELAKMIVKDGEGATKFIQIKVNQAKSFEQAKRAALAVANSNLFKTAMYASSKNVLGRIAASVGACGVDVKEQGLKIKYTDLSKNKVNLDIFLCRGKESAVIYTCDLTPEYVKINAEYN